MLFNELRKHHRLAAKRHPMYEKNRFGKFFMYFMSVFWAGYLIFFGTTFAFTFAEGIPNMEPYHVLNSGLIFVLALDFLSRFSFQKTPTQEVKPYLLLPIKKSRIQDFLLIRSGVDPFNFLWLFMFVPFAIITVTKYYGVMGVITYSLGIYLLMVLNNYWYLFCRTLINEKLYWIGLPLVVYAFIGVAAFLPKESIVDNLTMDLGEGYIEGNVLFFAGTLLAITAAWFINKWLLSKLAYSELNKVEDTKVKHVSDYSFLEKYGEIGEYLRLELKMLFRNKRCKTSLRMIAIIVVFFSLMLSFSGAYDGTFMKSFVSIYAFVAFGMVILTQIMSFEGNYIDGLMTRKESIFQLAVYNNKTVPLNEGVTGRQASGTGFQTIVSFTSFGLPMLLNFGLKSAFGETAGAFILLGIGLGFTLTAHIWIKNVYVRFMKRRYKNMEGFRDTK
jgi:hypothetical protein